jgi:hypothetical protein
MAFNCRRITDSGFHKMQSRFIRAHNEAATVAAMCVTHHEIDFRPWHNKLKLHRTRRRCGEMADATDLKSVGP